MTDNPTEAMGMDRSTEQALQAAHRASVKVIDTKPLPTEAMGAMTGEEAHTLLWEQGYGPYPETWDQFTEGQRDAWSALAAEISRRAITAEFVRQAETAEVPSDWADTFREMADGANEIVKELRAELAAERAQNAKLREVLENTNAWIRDVLSHPEVGEKAILRGLEKTLDINRQVLAKQRDAT